MHQCLKGLFKSGAHPGELFRNHDRLLCAARYSALMLIKIMNTTTAGCYCGWFGTDSSTSLLTLYRILTKQTHCCLVKKHQCSNLRESIMTCASNAHVLESATWPVLVVIKAVKSCTQPGTHTTILYLLQSNRTQSQNHDHLFFCSLG